MQAGKVKAQIGHIRIKIGRERDFVYFVAYNSGKIGILNKNPCKLRSDSSDSLQVFYFL